MHFGKVVKSDG